ncbi:MAG: hypothetical protein U7123_15915 [Potamolinea sp.]
MVLLYIPIGREQVAAAPTREYDVKQDFDKFVKQFLGWHSQKVAQRIDELFQEAYQGFNHDRKSV